MKQTAVEWLVEKLNQCEPMYSGVQSNEHKEYLEKLVEQAKEIEKEQKIDDIVQFGIKYHHKYSEGAIKKLCENAEEYYNETFKNDKK